VVAIAAGGYHALALLGSGRVVGWGFGGNGEISIPVEAQSSVVAIAGGAYHSMALLAGGTLVTFGQNDYRQLSYPGGLQGSISAISAGKWFSLALLVRARPPGLPPLSLNHHSP
jgi:alpha-tubulin suppressor-like RCC1 family protein